MNEVSDGQEHILPACCSQHLANRQLEKVPRQIIHSVKVYVFETDVNEHVLKFTAGVRDFCRTRLGCYFVPVLSCLPDPDHRRSSLDYEKAAVRFENSQYFKQRTQRRHRMVNSRDQERAVEVIRIQRNVVE